MSAAISQPRNRTAPLGGLVIVLLVLALCSACGGNEDSCALDDDCFKGEVCVDGACEPAPNAQTENNVVPNGTSNGSANSANGVNGANGSTTGVNGANVTTNGSNVAEGVCLVDPFTASCEPDDNDDFSDYVRFDDGAPGCDSGWDDFTGAQTSVEGAQLCALEIADKYNTNLVPCDNKTFVAEVTMTPREPCDPDDYRFNVAIQGNNCDEPSDDIRCEVLEDGSKRVTAFVRPSNSLAVLYLDVEKTDKDNVHFEYDIDILVRE